MSGEVLIASGAIFLLLLLSGFFSGSETALTAASRARIHRMARDGNKRAAHVDALAEVKERLIGTILLGNNLVNILASALATSVFIQLFGETGVIYATAVMTALVLIFAEVLPKTVSIINAERVSLMVGPIFRRVLVPVFAPVTAAVQWIVRGSLRLFGIDITADRAVLSAHDELRGTIDLHAREGGVRKAEKDMLGGILDLDLVEISEIMVHRRNMEVIDADEDREEIINQVVRSTKTRLPFWRNEPENIIGILHAKDALRAVRRSIEQGTDPDMESLLIEPWYVPETNTLREQLTAFRERKAHFALVVDEYGALQGLVTLEDILEEIVGEIDDEHDITKRGIRPQNDGRIIVDGAVTIRDLNREMEWELSDEHANTVAGFVIHNAQTIPDVGQIFRFDGFTFEILQRKRNQITSLRVTAPADTSA